MAHVPLLFIVLSCGALAVPAQSRPANTVMPGVSHGDSSPPIDARYWFSSSADRASSVAIHPMASLRVEVGVPGIRIQPLEAASWSLELALADVRRGNQKLKLRRGKLRAEQARCELDRGAAVEWVVNAAAGIEHGMTLHERVPGTGPLVVESTIDGSCRCAVEPDQRTLRVTDANGRLALCCAGLHAFDANGRDLPIKARVDNSRLQFEVDDREATYPITIDPVLTSPSWSWSSQQAGALGGQAMTVGDVNGDGFSDVVVGAWRYDNGQTDEGAAWLFLGTPAGLATTPALVMEGNVANAVFGAAVAPAGDVNGDGFFDWIVGAPGYSNGQAGEGAAFLYLGGQTPDATPDWVAEGNQAGALFGAAIAGAGDVNGDGYDDVIIGAHGFDNGQADEGMAFLYLGSAAGLTPTPAWTVESNVAGDWLGFSVACAGDVNADGYADVVVGLPKADVSGTDAGSVHIHHGSPTGPSPLPSGQLHGSNNGGQFGYAVAGCGDVNGDGYADVLVGAPFVAGNQGRAMLHLGTAAGVQATAAWSQQGQAGSQLGAAVASAGDVNGDGYADFVLGAPQSGGRGEVRFFQGGPSVASITSAWTNSGQSGSYYAGFVGSAGDVNGDGFGDLVIGAHAWDGPQVDSGMVFLHLGAPELPSPDADWIGTGTQAASLFGSSVANAGDVNGDGFEDALVGDPGHDGLSLDIGRSWLYFGSPSGLSTTAAWIRSETGQAFAQYGTNVTGLGDIDGDGYDEFAVGTPFFDEGGIVDAGKVWIYRGAAGSPSTIAAWTVSAAGKAVPMGDVNGDGYADFAVLHVGLSDFYLGSSGGPVPAPFPIPRDYCMSRPSQSGPTPVSRASFPLAVEFVAPTPAIPHSGFLVGDRQALFSSGDYLPGGDPCPAPPPLTVWSIDTRAGWVSMNGGPSYMSNTALSLGFRGLVPWSPGSVYPRPTSSCFVEQPGAVPFRTLVATNDWMIYAATQTTSTTTPVATGSATNAFGAAMTRLGDFDRDGNGEFAIGSPELPSSGNTFGSVHLYELAPGAINLLATRTVAQAMYGQSLAGGDWNGDGFTDLLVGAPAANSAFLRYGNDSAAGGDAGLDRVVEQRRVRNSSRISNRGWTDEWARVRIRATARTAAGRGRVRVVWEAKVVGTAFTGAASFESQPLDTGAPSGSGSAHTFDRVMSGLQPDQAYHWRLRTRSSSPFFPGTPWMHPAGMLPEETHFRTPPDTCQVSYTVIGSGIPGTGGHVPTLRGTGSACSATSPTGYGLGIANGLGGVFAVVALGFAPLNVAMFGGTLYTTMDALYPLVLNGGVGVPAAGTGLWSLGINLFPYPGIQLYAQAAVFDAGAVQGYALTNGIRLTVSP